MQAISEKTNEEIQAHFIEHVISFGNKVKEIIFTSKAINPVHVTKEKETITGHVFAISHMIRCQELDYIIVSREDGHNVSELILVMKECKWKYIQLKF